MNLSIMAHWSLYHVLLLHLLCGIIDSQSCYYHTQSLPEPTFGHVTVYSNYSNSVYLFGGRTTNADRNTVYKWNLTDTNSWFHPIGSTPTTRFFSYGNNAVVINNFIYFIGMEETSPVSGHIYVFDTATEAWLSHTIPIPAPIIPLSHGCLTTNSTHIFMVDGFNGASNQSRDAVIQIYNIAANTWSIWYFGGTFTYIGGYRYQCCSMVNNDLFIMGGRVGNPEYTNKIYKWNAIAQLLTFVAYLPNLQAWGVAAYADNFIYTVGSFPFTNNITAFDVRTETVSNTVYKMTQEIDAPAALVLNNALYIFGGENNSFGALSDVQICDLVTADLTDIPTASTSSPTTLSPITAQPTVSPITDRPTTTQPTTVQPTTSQPSTAPITDQPTTSQPTPAPITAQPTTAQPTTSQPTTAQPTTSQPTTAQPTTSQPTTAQPTTLQPTTTYPTLSPITGQPTTAQPTISQPTTPPITTTIITTIEAMASANEDVIDDTTATNEIDKNNANLGNSAQYNLVVILGIVGISILCLLLLFSVLIYIKLRFKVPHSSAATLEKETGHTPKFSAHNLQLDAVRSISSQSPHDPFQVYHITPAQLQYVESVSALSAVEPMAKYSIELAQTEFINTFGTNAPIAMNVESNYKRETAMVLTPTGDRDEGVNTDVNNCTNEGVLATETCTPGMEIYDYDNNGNDCDVDLLDLDEICMNPNSVRLQSD